MSRHGVVTVAGIREMALGLTTVLQRTPVPEPLPVDLWNEAPQDAVAMVKAVIAECRDAEVSLALVRLPKALWSWLDEEQYETPTGTQIEADGRLSDRIEFYRHRP